MMIDDPGICIRPYLHADVSAIAAIENERFATRAWPDEVLYMVPRLHAPFAFVAEADGLLAGYAFGAIAADNRSEGWLVSIAVRTTHERRNIGTRLVVAVAKSLHAHGAQTLRLTVTPNSPAMRLYERLGCRIAGFEPDFFGPGQARQILALPLG